MIRHLGKLDGLLVGLKKINVKVENEIKDIIPAVLKTKTTVKRKWLKVKFVLLEEQLMSGYMEEVCPVN